MIINSIRFHYFPFFLRKILIKQPSRKQKLWEIFEGNILNMKICKLMESWKSQVGLFILTWKWRVWSYMDIWTNGQSSFAFQFLGYIFDIWSGCGDGALRINIFIKFNNLILFEKNFHLSICPYNFTLIENASCYHFPVRETGQPEPPY